LYKNLANFGPVTVWVYFARLFTPSSSVSLATFTWWHHC